MRSGLFQFNRQHSTNGSSDLSETQTDGLVRVSRKNLIALRKQAESIPLNANKILSTQTGSYLSPFKGRGMEFEEARMYQPGDDIRNMDWRVTARTGTAHTKVFREERERAVLMWVDYRRPMFFATQGAFKSVLAARSAALLSWSAIQHGDRLGGLIFSEQQHVEIRPQRGDKAVLQFINKLANQPVLQDIPDTVIDNNNVAQSLSRLRRVARPGSLIILYSDFHAFDQQAESHLIQLARHNDVIMNFFYDPLEDQLPQNGLYHISDGRQRTLLNTTDKHLCETHTQRFAQHRDYLQTLARRYGMFFISCATNQDIVTNLQYQLGLKRK
jgi:uncharacterized protein (DUF58 family)